MSELPKISGDEAIKVFKRLGFYEARQKGGHVVLRKEDRGCVIPLHYLNLNNGFSIPSQLSFGSYLAPIT
ncbi:MAG: type II toxin-antitoxin system HicA family toxin [Desulfobacterales bacterium]|nr:type II toxin-antitoxin system HicA family toxin [Desulfobacterales bacterium]